jgi:hypothetical protein
MILFQSRVPAIEIFIEFYHIVSYPFSQFLSVRHFHDIQIAMVIKPHSPEDIFGHEGHFLKLLPRHAILFFVIHHKQCLQHLPSISLSLLPLLVLSFFVQFEELFAGQGRIVVGIVLGKDMQKLLLELIDFGMREVQRLVELRMVMVVRT